MKKSILYAVHETSNQQQNKRGSDNMESLTTEYLTKRYKGHRRSMIMQTKGFKQTIIKKQTHTHTS